MDIKEYMNKTVGEELQGSRDGKRAIYPSVITKY